MKIQTFDSIVDHIWDTKQQFVDGKYFDFPDYGGLSADIIKELSPEAVDAMQITLSEIDTLFSHKALEFVYYHHLRVLGESLEI